MIDNGINNYALIKYNKILQIWFQPEKVFE